MALAVPARVALVVSSSANRQPGLKRKASIRKGRSLTLSRNAEQDEGEEKARERMVEVKRNLGIILGHHSLTTE